MRSRLETVPAQVASIRDYERLAQAKLDPGIWAYFAGGSGEEWTARENEAAFDRLPLQPRVLRDMSGANTSLTLLGCDLPSPMLLAPIAFQRMVHDDGERASLEAADVLGLGAILSTQSSIALEEFSGQTSPLWFQLYIQPDRDFTLSLVRRAEQAGYRALVVTVDAPVNGMRYREQRSGFQMPDGVEAANLRGMTPLPPAPEGTLLFGTPLLNSAPTWEDIDWLQAHSSLPVLLKGVSSADDANRALDHGVAGLILSNHGGRALDGTPATIDLLPSVAAAVGGAVPLLMDGGIRRGGDVVRALALGADAVLIGRAYVYALAVAGLAGVVHAMRLLQAELELTMALTGCATLRDIRHNALAAG